jgi:hypothetical protein
MRDISALKKKWYYEAKDKMEGSKLWCMSLDGTCHGTKGADGIFVHDPTCSLARQVREYAKFADPPQGDLEFEDSEPAAGV